MNVVPKDYINIRILQTLVSGIPHFVGHEVDRISGVQRACIRVLSKIRFYPLQDGCNNIAVPCSPIHGHSIIYLNRTPEYDIVIMVSPTCGSNYLQFRRLYPLIEL